MNSRSPGERREFLAAFHGQFPQPEAPLSGECSVREGNFERTGSLIGNRVWLDADENGVQGIDEVGIPGICVDLLDGGGKLVSSTTTDTNGMYGFNVEQGVTYRLEFGKPDYLDFTDANLGYEDEDSDVEPSTGQTRAFKGDEAGMDWDAGLVRNGSPLPAGARSETLPAAEVGPVRSGRLLYAYLARSYTDSCLIYAFASPEILEKLPHCAFVSHEDENGGETITIDRIRAVAEDNMRRTADRAFNYASNLYSDSAPEGGLPASELKVFYSNTDQSGWTYDPLYQAYLRYVDTANVNAEGVLHADVDRTHRTSAAL